MDRTSAASQVAKRIFCTRRECTFGIFVQSGNDFFGFFNLKIDVVSSWRKLEALL